jgi:hypothetical protein
MASIDRRSFCTAMNGFQFFIIIMSSLFIVWHFCPNRPITKSGSSGNLNSGVKTTSNSILIPNRQLISENFDIRKNLQWLSNQIIQANKGVQFCEVQMFGSGWGKHALCKNKLKKGNCNFYSFGISNDYTFDTDLAQTYSCNGFAADPTITHPSKLHDKVTFHNVGATLLSESKFPIVTSLPSLKSWLRHDFIDVLKMDCEGCEYALARDILLENPKFFDQVGQFSVEIHFSKLWLGSQLAEISLAALLQLLQESGFSLAHADITRCASHDEQTGLLPEMLSFVGTGGHCHNYLFSRPTRKHAQQS